MAEQPRGGHSMMGVFVQLNERSHMGQRAPVGYVIGENACWLWVGPKDPKGYGVFKDHGRAIKAHRYMYLREVGPVPDGLVLDHFACDTPSCVNPAHLRPVTSRENTLRSAKTLAHQQLARTHCPQGHPLSGDNLRPSTEGRRRCRICKNDGARRLRKEAA